MTATLETYQKLKESETYMSRTAIAREVGRHPETIGKALKCLEELGYLEKAETNNTTYFQLKGVEQSETVNPL